MKKYYLMAVNMNDHDIMYKLGEYYLIRYIQFNLLYILFSVILSNFNI
jgi:hypothetical protein